MLIKFFSMRDFTDGELCQSRIKNATRNESVRKVSELTEDQKTLLLVWGVGSGHGEVNVY